MRSYLVLFRMNIKTQHSDLLVLLEDEFTDSFTPPLTNKTNEELWHRKAITIIYPLYFQFQSSVLKSLEYCDISFPSFVFNKNSVPNKVRCISKTTVLVFRRALFKTVVPYLRVERKLTNKIVHFMFPQRTKTKAYCWLPVHMSLCCEWLTK